MEDKSRKLNKTKNTRSMKIAVTVMALVLATGGLFPFSVDAFAAENQYSSTAQLDTYGVTVMKGEGFDDEKEESTSVKKTTPKSTASTTTKKTTETTTKKETKTTESKATESTSTVKATAKAFNRKASTADAKKNTNSDTVGWLYIPNTNINYPVVQNRTSNDYYMQLGYDKKYSFNGVLWTDYRGYADTYSSGNKFSKNIVIFGHNWKNVRKPIRTLANAIPEDVMFGLLPSYTYLDFAQKTPFVYYSTDDYNLTYQVFASFYADRNFDYVYSDPVKDQYQKIIDTALAKSEHDYGVNVTTDDYIITLSTCTRVNGSSSEQRYIVMGKKVPDGTKATTIK